MTGKIEDSYSNWAEWEPNNVGGNEDCLVFCIDGWGHQDKWNDLPCELKLSFICQFTG